MEKVTGRRYRRPVGSVAHSGHNDRLAVPAVLDTDSEAFIRWRDTPGWDTSGWTAYAP